MKKISITALVLAGCLYGRAQVTVKKDVIAYFRQLPSPPATLEEAYKHCHCLSTAGTVQAGGTGVAAGVHSSITADLQSMGKFTNGEAQQVKQATALHDQAVADNVSGMSKDQQLSWVKNNMQGYGNASGDAAFAQKMRDPAELAKFKAMTPDQKLAYMKANGLDPMKGAAVAKQGASPVVAGPMAASPVGASPVAMAEGLQIRIQNDLAQPRANPWGAALQQLLAESWNGGAADAQRRLVAMNDNYRRLLAFYMHIDSAYGVAMTAANYGYTGDAGQDNGITKLATGQYLILNQVAQLEAFLNGIYQFGAVQAGKSQKGK